MALRHIVVFKFVPGASPAAVQQVIDALGALRQSIPGIVDFEHGVNNSPEGKHLGFTHVCLLSFADAQARDAYLPHPEHQRFGSFLRSLGILQDVFVVDYEPIR